MTALREPDVPRESPEESEPQAAVTFSTRQIERVRDLLGRLSGALRCLRFYPPEHPAVDAAVEGLMGVIGEYHAEGVDVPLTFFEDELLLGEQMLLEDSVLFDQLIRDMTAIGAGSVTFERGLDAAELGRFVAALATDDADIEAGGGLQKLLENAGLQHVTVAAVQLLEGPADKEDGHTARDSYGSALDLLRDLEMALRTRLTLPAGQTRSVVRSLVDNVLSNRFAMLELAGLKDFDEYTFYHSVNVAILSLALGSAVSEDRRFLSSLGAGALLHDVGKMTIGGDVLNKPGALTSEEWAQVRLHPVRGAEIVATMSGMDKASVVVILEHHMRFDGRGYPAVNGHTGQHLASRIVAVADAFEAMTSKRSYSAARLPDESMATLVDNMGSALDPALVSLFVRIMGVYPPRSVVRLDSGEVGIVLRPAETDLVRPVVRVIAGPDGALMQPSDMDLSEQDDRSVVSCLDPRGLNVDVDEYL